VCPRRLSDVGVRPLNFTVRRQAMTPREFQDRMDTLLDSLCAARALDPLRTLLPHWLMPNGFTDEWAALAAALKTVRMQQRDALSAADLELVVSLQHAAESALEGKR
jgi:hypothetical protein